jgi:hypothetical protein
MTCGFTPRGGAQPLDLVLVAVILAEPILHLKYVGRGVEILPLAHTVLAQILPPGLRAQLTLFYGVGKLRLPSFPFVQCGSAANAINDGVNAFGEDVKYFVDNGLSRPPGPFHRRPRSDCG